MVHASNRRIRSAGRTSGSVEITLPAELQVLEGLECRIVVRDGPRPEIVLQPDVSLAQSVLKELWRKLRVGLGEIGEIGDFSAGDFNMALLPPRHWQDRPPLAYADALAVGREQPWPMGDGRGALGRLLAFLAVAAAYRTGLVGPLALAFGDAVSYLITGATVGLGTDFERGMAQMAFWGKTNGQVTGSCFNDEVWQKAQPGFRRVYDRFLEWQQHPEAYATVREHWYKALTLEVGAKTPPVEKYVGQYKEMQL
jgi:hypothetical protein